MTRYAELDLQADMIKDLHSQGFWASKTSERFVAGKPDLRVARKDKGQLDVELKYINASNGVVQSGLSALQKIEIRDMNRAGMPAIALSYVESREIFIIHHLREIDLDSDDLYMIQRSPRPGVIDGVKLMDMAFYYLEEHVI